MKKPSTVPSCIALNASSSVAIWLQQRSFTSIDPPLYSSTKFSKCFPNRPYIEASGAPKPTFMVTSAANDEVAVTQNVAIAAVSPRILRNFISNSLL